MCGAAGELDRGVPCQTCADAGAQAGVQDAALEGPDHGQDVSQREHRQQDDHQHHGAALVVVPHRLATQDLFGWVGVCAWVTGQASGWRGLRGLI